MPTIQDLEASLPWGLHDAHLEQLELDWPGRRATITVRLRMSERQDRERRARIVVTGLVYCAIDPPDLRAPDREPSPVAGLWIASHDEPGPGQLPARHPATPEGCFVSRMFVSDWNAFLYVCGRDASLTWLEPDSVPARAGTGIAFPGDEIDIPDGG